MTDQLPTKIIEARARLLMKQPFFASHLLTNNRVEYQPEAKLCHTDGTKIVLNDWFCGLPMDQRIFVLCHEVCHMLFGHITRLGMYKRRGFGPDMGAFDQARMAKAADYHINALLVDSQIGQMPAEALYDPSLGADLTVDQIYERLPATPKPPPGEDEGEGEGEGDGQGEGNGPPSGNFDEHEPPPDQPGQPVPTEQEIERDVQAAVKAAEAAAKAAGVGLGGALGRLIGAITEPQVAWDEQLRQFCVSVPKGSELTWSRINRRRLCSYPYLPYPGKDGHEIEAMVIAVDASGSIGANELAAFMAEMRSIMETVRPRECWVLWWDTEVTPVEIIDPEDLEAMTPYGGGGTVYDCVPRWIEQQGLDPDIVVCMTDGWIDTSLTSVPYPHLTVSTTNQEMPFGHNIRMEL